MVHCKSFQMYNISLSQLWGKTPVVHYICGSCGRYNEGRMSVAQVKMGDPYLKCGCCGELNYIPITYDNN